MTPAPRSLAAACIAPTRARTCRLGGARRLRYAVPDDGYPHTYEVAKVLLPAPLKAALAMLEPGWAPPNALDMATAALEDTVVY